ncbi:MAG: discoidin domain-containing protein [Candidatus Methanoperedens sp.]|nr:discoidin domain-containing protein [Candidatus Methanoperedens sp.]
MALNKTVYVSGVIDPYTANKSVDGNLDTLWVAGVVYPSWWIVDLGTNYRVDQIQLKYGSNFNYNLNISTSLNNITYTEVYSNASYYLGTCCFPGFEPTITFPITTARYVKIWIISNPFNPADIAALYEVNINVSEPVLFSPVNASNLTKIYPPLTTSINFTWLDMGISSSNLLIAKDIYFNLIAVNTTVSTNYSSQSLEAGNYWWKVRYYNSTAGTYGNYSDTFNFTIQSIQTVAANNSIQGTVYEIVGGAVTPISGADVFIYNATYSTSQRTGTNGYYLFQGLSGTYNIYATKQGYDTTVALPVTASANSSVINNILMKIYISSYVPNFVFERFIVRNLFDTPYPGVTITVYKGDDLTASFTGMTDSIGQAVFQLIKDQKYRITLSGGGISGTLTFTVYGKEEDYIIRIAGGFPTGGNRYTDINATLTSSTVNATHSNLSLIYRDNRSSTTAINFYATNLSTNSTCTQSSTSQNVTLSCTVLASGTYQFGFNATSSIYGFFQQDRIINFGAGKPASPSLAVPGVSSTYLHWISIMLIVLTASLFSVKTVKYGAVVIPSVAMIFWAVGWLQISFLLVSTALVIGVLVYSRMSETKVVYS